MVEKADSRANAAGHRTTVERPSDRETLVRRTFNAPARIVFEAWTKPELFKQWWAPKSMGVPILSCDMDVRTGGGYRIAFGHDEAQSMAFFGKYLEVTPPSRLVWTNAESEPGSVTTVTFEDKDGKTHLVVSELFPSKEAFEEGGGAEAGLPEQFEQLDELLLTLAARE